MDNGLDLATPMQWLMSVSQAAYAAVGLLAIVCWWRQSRLTRALLLLWGTLVVATVALIPIAWAPEELSSTPTFALAGAAIALLVGGSVWASTRRP